MNIGVLLRTYSPRHEDIEANVKMIEEVVARLFAIPYRPGGKNPFCTRVDILVWRDDRYRDSAGNRLADCGGTPPALRSAFMNDVRISVHEIPRADIYATILNYGIARQYSFLMDYSLVLSKEVIGYVNQETIWAMIEVMRRGALVASVAVNEIRDLVIRGCVSNTFALWHLPSLLQVGGFDIRDAKPLPGDESHVVPYWPQGRELSEEPFWIHDAGVGEVLPACHLFREFGRPVIASILPQGEAIQGEYRQENENPDRVAWNKAKFATKKARLESILKRSGYSFEDLEQAVMPAYRHW
ncbi:MAG: hypothetical protein AAB604_02395 [Patescibacteria group bacterium]